MFLCCLAGKLSKAKDLTIRHLITMILRAMSVRSSIPSPMAGRVSSNLSIISLSTRYPLYQIVGEYKNLLRKPYSRSFHPWWLCSDLTLNRLDSVMPPRMTLATSLKARHQIPPSLPKQKGNILHFNSAIMVHICPLHFTECCEADDGMIIVWLNGWRGSDIAVL